MHATELQIHCCRIEDIEPALIDDCISLLGEHEQQRLSQFHAAAPRREFILSRALLRTVLAARLEVAPTALRFERDADGKPQLAAPFAQWHFNLSHSGEWVALALGNAGPVGIDIESHARKNNLAAIARRFFSGAENEALRHPAQADAQLDAAWLERFFAIWTLKEAHAKALGCGLSKILSCSSFIPPADFSRAAAIARIDLLLSGIAAPAQPVTTWLYRPDAQTSLAISQLGSQAVTPSLQQWSPRAHGAATTRYFELAPIATGSWRPDAPPTPDIFVTDARPRA
jgi:4'-phosphopantetheinyl transferase